MTSTNNRTINGYETIDGELVLSEITNSVLVTDSDGLVYGINNYISNLTSDAQAQITTIDNNITTIEGEITTINNNITIIEGDKQNLFLNNISSTLTSNIANYNYVFRRSDTSGQNFYIGNSNTTTTAQSNLYLSGPNNNSAFSISVGNGSTTLTHNNSGNWGFNSAQSQNMYFQFNGATNLRMTSTAADFYNDVYVTGTTNLTGALTLTTKLDPQYILTSTGSLT